MGSGSPLPAEHKYEYPGHRASPMTEPHTSFPVTHHLLPPLKDASRAALPQLCVFAPPLCSSAHFIDAPAPGQGEPLLPQRHHGTRRLSWLSAPGASPRIPVSCMPSLPLWTARSSRALTTNPPLRRAETQNSPIYRQHDILPG